MTAAVAHEKMAALQDQYLEGGHAGHDLQVVETQNIQQQEPQ